MTAKFRTPDEIVSEFNTKSRALISRAEKKSRRSSEIAQIDRLKKRLNLLRMTMGDSAILVESTPFFLNYSDVILDRSKYDDMILNLDLRKEYSKYKQSIGSEDEIIISLIESIRLHHVVSSQQDKDDVYADVRRLLNCCVEYKLVVSPD